MAYKKSIVLVLSMIILGSSLAQAGEVTLSVAASMTDAFKSLAEHYQSTHPDIILRYNFGSSGSLAKQISQGAPADIFVSANTRWMDYLAQEKHIDVSSIRIFAHNNLVFVGKKGMHVTSLADLSGLERIAIGSPQSVPAGQYAEQAMRAVGIYDTLLAEHKLVMAKDVRQALLYADKNETDGAFVYRTDARLAQNAVILFTVPQNLYTRIAYPLALTRLGKDKTEARSVYQYLNSAEALEILESYGFEAPMKVASAKP